MKRTQGALLQVAHRLSKPHHVPDFQGNIRIEHLALDPFEHGDPKSAAVDVGQDVHQQVVVILFAIRPKCDELLWVQCVANGLPISVCALRNR